MTEKPTRQEQEKTDDKKMTTQVDKVWAFGELRQSQKDLESGTCSVLLVRAREWHDSFDTTEKSKSNLSTSQLMSGKLLRPWCLQDSWAATVFSRSFSFFWRYWAPLPLRLSLTPTPTILGRGLHSVVQEW